jgi:hypothetical protein
MTRLPPFQHGAGWDVVEAGTIHSRVMRMAGAVAPSSAVRRVR